MGFCPFFGRNFVPCQGKRTLISANSWTWWTTWKGTPWRRLPAKFGKPQCNRAAGTSVLTACSMTSRALIWLGMLIKIIGRQCFCIVRTHAFLCVYFSLRAYISAQIHAYVHTLIRAYMHTCIHAHVHTCIRSYMHTCIPAYRCKRAYMNTHVPTCIRAYVHAYMHACFRAYMHTCIHAYVHTCACRHTRIRGYMHTCIRAWMHTCIHAYAHMCIRAYICVHACMHTCIRAYVHTYTVNVFHSSMHQTPKRLQSSVYWTPMPSSRSLWNRAVYGINRKRGKWVGEEAADMFLKLQEVRGCLDPWGVPVDFSQSGCKGFQFEDGGSISASSRTNLATSKALNQHFHKFKKFGSLTI